MPTEQFDTPGTTPWVSPLTGTVRVRGWAGGAGGGVNNNAEGGGAGGGYSEADVAVVKDQSYDLIIGAGGGPGVDGGDTLFADGADVLALGGLAGSTVSGGASPGAGTGTIATAGGNGGSGSAGAGNRAGGGGGGSGGDTGNGGNGGNAAVDVPGVAGAAGTTNGAAGGIGGANGANGANGVAPGGGGGGGGKGGGNSGTGANGRITLTYELAGYKVFLTENREADPATDSPVATVEADELPLAIVAALASLSATKTYYISVCAFNATGDSSIISARFVTDGSGDPQLRPTPVHHLTVTPLAGGLADVRWQYDEGIESLRADTFAIEVLSLTGGAPVVVADVTATEAREYFKRIGPGADGDYRVKVFAELDGQYETAVTGVDVRLDATPPVGTVPPIAVI